METHTLEERLRDIRTQITEDLAYWWQTLGKPIANPHACLTNLYDALHKNFRPLLDAYIDSLGLDWETAHQVQSQCLPADSYFCNASFAAEVITHPADHAAFVALHTTYANLLLGAELDLKKAEWPVMSGEDNVNYLVYAMAKTMSAAECRSRLEAARPAIELAHDSLVAADLAIPTPNRESIAAALPPQASFEEIMKKNKPGRLKRLRQNLCTILRR